MAKRVVTRVGDVFSVEFGDGYKRYFQYVCKDLSQLNSAVIYIFKTKYPVIDNPDLEEIVRDEVSYCIHVFLRFGLWEDVWHKVGHAKYINFDAVEAAIFGNALDTKFVYGEEKVNARLERYISSDLLTVDPMTNWWLWKAGGERICVGTLPRGFEDKVVDGSVQPPKVVKEWMKYGYDRFTAAEYRGIKRKPWDDVDSYVKIEEGDEVRYFHFLGQEPMREMVVSRSGIVRLSREHPESQGETLRRAEFWETNWESKNFIEAEEFEKLW